MIARVWSGTVPAGSAAGFAAHLEATVVDETRAAGAAGALVLQRTVGNRTRFVLLSFWRDREAIAAFAGPDVERAVLYRGDEAFGLQSDPTVTHWLATGGIEAEPTEGRSRA